MRNFDDCIDIYGHRWKYYEEVKNIPVRNSTLWANVVHPINVGAHGDPQNLETIEDLVFSNLDILSQKESQADYQGCVAINAGNDNLIRNVRFENIRVEDFREGRLLNLRVMYNHKYNSALGRDIENILFGDASYHGSRANWSLISGYDDERQVKDMVFENLRINEQQITGNMQDKPAWCKTSDMAHVIVGEHVQDAVSRESF